MKYVIRHVSTQQIIGPFDTREEAAAWAQEEMPMETLDFEDMMSPAEFFPGRAFPSGSVERA